MSGTKVKFGPAKVVVWLGGLLLTAVLAGPASAQSAAELFLRLPDAECGGYSPTERELMLNAAIEAPGAEGRRVPPDAAHPRVRLVSSNYLVLHRPGRVGDISYKLFPGRGFDLLAVCRGRLPAAPMDPACPFDLCLYRHDAAGLSRVEQDEYLPSVTILDFITADTLTDPNAVRDIARRAPAYGLCLTCNATVQDPSALDVLTVTTVNAAACADFLPPFGLLRLTWNGTDFTKPYDRAAPRDKR